MNSIQNLSSSNFNITNNNLYIKSTNTPGMLLIWASWCGHCHNFLPIYKKICRRLGQDFTCAAIEHSELKENKSLSSALDFKYFPTIKFFDQYGKIIGDYDGERDELSILDSICKMFHHCINYH